MRLNLGCADRYVRDWVNVDFGSPHRVDQRVDLTGELPWPHGSVKHVYAGHLFEHLTRAECVGLARRLLPCMNPAGGILMVVGPDMRVARGMYADGTLDTRHHTIDTIIHGGGRWAGDEHQWETTGAEVVAVLHEAGWPVARSIPMSEVSVFWPVVDRDQPWQFAVRAWVGELP